ncbi:MAG: hypothetical protein LBT31_07695 [Synergistaceae bacterium]|jgi:hypothetical protein|nr:hypothetical protein [Synergistaceae bacterium]
MDVNWPPELRVYLDSVESALAKARVEHTVRAGVIRDLETQISEMRAEGIPDDEILSRLDPPEAYVDPQSLLDVGPDRKPPAIPVQAPPVPFPRISDVLYVVVAIVAAVAVLTEELSHICAETFGDPIPTWLHFASLVSVPFILLITIAKMRRGISRFSLPPLTFLNGYLVAVGFWYTLMFLPLMPFAFLSTFLMGLGLLPLAPLLTFVAALLQNFQLYRCGQAVYKRPGHWRFWFAGLALAVLLLGGAQFRQFVTDHYARLAVGGDPETRASGLKMLKRLHLEGAVLEYCYSENHQRLWGELPFTRQHLPYLAPSGYQTLYYRMTGTDYRDVQKTEYRRGNRQRVRNAEDAEVGGDAVASSSRLLSLKSAAMDISFAGSPSGLDAGPSLAYAELTLEFLNRDSSAKEARCQIIMPPGGVVSRLTLWINGEEREAAFGRRGAVREAYSQVAVVQSRDPALLTTAGPDRVLLQCFPVNPDVPMRVKVGFTLPLIPDDGRMALLMPYIAERNFAFEPGQRVALWAESEAPLQTDVEELLNEVVPSRSNGAGDLGYIYAVRGDMPPENLASVRIFAPSPTPETTIYRAELSGVTAYSSLSEARPLERRLVALVIDTSAQCAELFSPDDFDWITVLEELPDNVRIALFAGGISCPPMNREEAKRRWPEILRGVNFAGADDQADSLAGAWDLCASEQNSVVLWLHGKLPVEISDMTGLNQRMLRRPSSDGYSSPRLLSMQLLPGPNRIEEKLTGLLRLPLFYGQPLERRLSRVLSMSLHPTMNDRELAFSLQRPTSGADAETLSGSPHIARLAFAAEIATKHREQQVSLPEEDIETAIKLRLVTPITGAVVLENERQYAEHDLDPSVEVEKVPTIPEPEEIALFAVALALLLLLFLLDRRRALHSGGDAA